MVGVSDAAAPGVVADGDAVGVRAGFGVADGRGVRVRVGLAVLERDGFAVLSGVGAGAESVGQS